MRYLKFIFIIVFSYSGISGVFAQTPPKLLDIDFITEDSSNPPTAGLDPSNNDVIIELFFDSAMNPLITPTVSFGLRNATLQNLNFQNSVWSGQTWQGTFTVTKNLPQTADGEYVFEISGARNIPGTEMDVTSSLDVNGQDSTLYICRSGRLELSTSTLDFDTLTFGRDKVLSFTVSNVSCEDLQVNSIVVPSPFSLYQTPSAFQLTPGSDIQVSIRYNPQERASHSGTIIINSDDIYQNAHYIETSGAAAGPQIRVVADSPVTFGTLAIGDDSTRSILVLNESAGGDAFNRPLEVNNIVLSSSAFNIDAGQFTVAPGDTQVVEVTFEPLSRGLYNSTLQISNNDLKNQVVVVFLRGRGGEDSIPDKPIDLNVEYSSFDRFVSATEFEACWENPEDPVGLTEIWWKFSQEQDPPQSPFDTSDAGGRYAFGNETCVTIPLQGNVSPGLWRVYFWLVDLEENSGYENYTTRFVYYDPTPPGAPVVTGRSIPEEQWFGSGDEFSITIQIPADVATGNVDANQVRWKYKLAPTGSRDFDNRYFFQEDEVTEVTFSVPFEINDLCGEDELYIWLADSAGNVDYQATTEVPYRFDICSGFATDFEVEWSNFTGYTNQTELPVCWTPASGAEEISEIWWKFSQTPVPPQNSTDTTSFGSRVVLSENTTCFNLPLASSLTTGHWYTYIWAVLENGSRASYADPISLEFDYDIDAPSAPQVISNTIPPATWIVNPDTFEITVTLPVEAGKTTSDVSELRWKFKTPPNTADDYHNRYIFDDDTTLRRTAQIVFDSPEFCGDDLLYIWFSDSAGNSSLNNITGIPYLLDICAPEITQYNSKSERTVLLGEAFSDTIYVNDDAGLDSVWAEYRTGGAENTRQLLLTQIPATSEYTFQISSDLFGNRGLEYRILAKDNRGNVGSGPLLDNVCNLEEIWIPVQTRIEGEGVMPLDGDGIPIPLLPIDGQVSYQLFSVPFEVEQNSISSVLRDDLGKYKKSRWRLLQYKPENPDGQRYLEGEEADPFIPGRSYFLITSQENIVVDTGPVISTKTVCPDSIRLYGGWNLVATPYNFSVSENNLSLVNSDNSIRLQKYDSGWTEVEVMRPWQGYALFVTASDTTEPIYLVVQPKAETASLSKIKYSTLRAGEWQIQVSGNAGRLHDSENWLGVRENALPGYDEYELAEPPVVGDYLKITVPQKNWSQPTTEFSTDFRPFSEDEITWIFEVQTYNAGEVNINFDFQGDVPENREFYLIDENYGQTQNLKSKPVFRFNAGVSSLTKKIKIVAGSLDYVREQAGSIELVPQKFELFQNFPNPFNPETTIRFDLPEAATVNLEVFDLLGRQVVRLIDEEKRAPGFYLTTWNGQDNSGKQAASGVYIYRLKAGKKTYIRKMILLK